MEARYWFSMGAITGLRDVLGRGTAPKHVPVCASENGRVSLLDLKTGNEGNGSKGKRGWVHGGG